MSYPPYGDGNQGGFQPPPAQPDPFGQPQPQSAPPAPGQPYSSQPVSQPYSSPPAPGQPYPSPPVSQPYSSPPVSQPYSSPPASQPYSAPPGYGPDPAASFSGPGYGNDPYAAGLPPTSGPAMMGPTPPSGQPKSKLAPIFASLMVVFLLATAVVTVLYVTKNGDYNDHKKAAATKEQQLSGDLKKTQDDLKKAQDELASTKRDLGGAQDQADELKRQKSVISQCIKLLVEAGDASRAGNAALAQQKQTEATPVCNEADRYLD